MYGRSYAEDVFLRVLASALRYLFCVFMQPSPTRDAGTAVKRVRPPGKFRSVIGFLEELALHTELFQIIQDDGSETDQPVE